MARSFLADLSEGERLATWRLARLDGSLAGHGSGLPELFATVHATRLVGRLFRHLPDRVLDALYDVVARNRSALGRLVPDGPAPRRFP